MKPEDYHKEAKLKIRAEVLSGMKLITESGCWEFTGKQNTYGYGIFFYDGRIWLTHRLTYYLTNGPIQDKLLCCHKCDNKICMNPDHIFLGTHKENKQDYAKKRLCVLSAKNRQVKLRTAQLTIYSKLPIHQKINAKSNLQRYKGRTTRSIWKNKILAYRPELFNPEYLR